MTEFIDAAEMVDILTSIARDPGQVGLTRVRAVNALREIEANQPPEDSDGEVASMEAFMSRRKTPPHLPSSG